VGIGTIAPTSRLQVDGNAHFGSNADTDAHTIIGSASVTCSNTAGALIVNQQGTGKIFELQNSGTARITVLDGGNVGIGIANPTQKLYVVGDTRIEGNLTVNGTQTVINTDVITTEQLLVTNNGTGPALVVNQTGAQPVIDIQDDGVSVMKIVNNGNIGMGTTDPTQRLHVQGSILATTQHLGPAADTSNAPGFSWSGDSNTGIYRPAADAVGVVTGGVERMRVLANGNVGINAISPSSLFQINQNSGNVYSTIANNTINVFGASTIPGTSSVNQATLFVNTNDAYAENKGASVALGGRSYNFGGGELHMSYARISGVQNSGTGYNGNFVIETQREGEMSERVRVNSSGNVGIGTTNPQAKLHVNGTLIATGTVIQTKTNHIFNNQGTNMVVQSNTNEQIVGTLLAFTPISSTSTILLNVRFHALFAGTLTTVSFFIRKNAIGTANGITSTSTIGDLSVNPVAFGNAGAHLPYTIVSFDKPATTNTINYQFVVQNQNAATITSIWNSAGIIITAQEIAA